MKAFCAKSLRLRPDYNAERERGNQRLHACPETTRCPTTCYERIGTYQEMAWPSTTSQTRKNSSLIRLEGAAATTEGDRQDENSMDGGHSGGSRDGNRLSKEAASRDRHQGRGRLRVGRQGHCRHAGAARERRRRYRPRSAVDAR